MVRSVVDYEAANPNKGARARGSLQLELGVDVSGPRPVVVSESSRNITPVAPAPVSVSEVRAAPLAKRAEEPRRYPRARSVVQEVWIEEDEEWLD